MKKIISLIIASVFALSMNAQNSKEKVEFTLTLRDGNVMKGTTTITKVMLETDYGKLDLPIKFVNTIEFGIIPDKTKTDKINNLLKQLYSTDETQRKSAYDELEKMEMNAIPTISDFIFSTTLESIEGNEYTPENILNDLKGKFGIDEDFISKDIVSYDNEYKAGGSYTLKEISLKTEYGSLTIPKEKIKNIEVMYSNFDASNSNFKLMASKNISSNTNGGWLKTGIMVKSGQKLTINATGKVILKSLSGNTYYSNGSTTSATDGGEDFVDGEDVTTSTYPSYGNVVYKIGDSGETIKVGAKYNGTVTSSGMLYLSIYETIYDAGNTGFYTVTVKVN
ncbi:MAG: hypothetical protein AUJ97_08070 [Bacteroidetes bacterium CG2_30_32_10]|nr:MAG: hypothetical protein AUJ97_08070 [Bacteroidetes bacterium CG2_30_32_10]